MIKLLRNSDKWSLLTAAALIIILALSAQDLDQSVTKLVTRQQKVTDNLKLWLASYRALQHIGQEWKDTLKSAAALDLLALYKAIDPESAGLNCNADKILIEKIDRLNFNDMELEASLVYVNTAGSPGFVVTAHSWSQLINGLEKLAHRRDIKMHAITIDAGRKDAEPTAIIYDLAIILRDGDVNEPTN